MQYGVTVTVVRSDADCNGYPATWEAIKTFAFYLSLPEYEFDASSTLFDMKCRRPLK